MRTIFLFIFSGLLLIQPLLVSGQHLQRRPFLGVQLTPVSDSIAAAHGMKSIEGARVAGVIPNSTAASLKLQPEDIILQVNNKPIKEVGQVVSMAREFKTDEKITLTLSRNGKTVTAKGKVQPMPLESAPNAAIQYDEVALSGNKGHVRSIIKKPKGEGVFPAVFFLQGFGCYSMDNLPEKDSQRQLIDGLIARGYAVFRMEKPGVGDSKGDSQCSEIGYDEEKDAFLAGLKALKQYDFIDTDNIFLFGHSLGANTAPLIASEEKVKGIISYGVAGKPWYEYLLKLSRDQQTMVGGDFVEAEERMKVAIPLLYEFLILKKSPQELTNNSAYRSYLENNFGYDGQGHLFGRHYTFLQELSDAPMVKAWRDANAHALTIYGEADLAALDPEGAKFITDLVNSYHPGKGTYKFLPETDHGFIKVGTKQDYDRLMESGKYWQYAQQNFNPAIVEIVDQWMKDKISKG